MEFCDKHNMVAFLQKPSGSEDFHQIVDFLAGSHIRYALTANPTIYVSLVEQFWQTATVETVNDGEQQINVTVDGHKFAITEASVRRHLQLADVDGISSLPNTDIFEQLTLMGYVFTDDKLTFKKAKFSPQWRFLIHTILHCLSPKKTSWEQFSSNIATAIICLATNRTFKFSQLIFDGMVKNVGSKTKFLMYPRFIQIFLNKKKRFLNKHKAIYVAPSLTQKLFSNMKIGFSGVHVPLFETMLLHDQPGQGEGPTLTVESQHTPIASPSTSQPTTSQPTTSHPTPSQEPPSQFPTSEPITTTSSPPFHETHIPQTTSSMPHDSPLPGGYTPGSVEGSMKLNELTDLCTKLVDRVTSLEKELKQTKEVHGKALTKLVKKVKKLEDKLKSTTKRRKARVVISEDEENLVSEDSSKQGRMTETAYEDIETRYAEVEYDLDQTEQHITPTKDLQSEEQNQEAFEAELSALSAAKILAEASKERVKTYNRRKRSTDSSKVSTAAGLFSTAEETEQTKALEQQEQERINLEADKKTQKYG
ncbi:hypothetical protein Tco_1248179 [Tanacetum coccineum]